MGTRGLRRWADDWQPVSESLPDRRNCTVKSSRIRLIVGFSSHYIRLAPVRELDCVRSVQRRSLKVGSSRQAGQVSPVQFGDKIAQIGRFLSVFNGKLREFSAVQTAWRRERDSNPRYPFRYSGFQDRLFQPLTHPSAVAGSKFSSFLACIKGIAPAQQLDSQLARRGEELFFSSKSDDQLALARPVQFHQHHSLPGAENELASLKRQGHRRSDQR